MNRGDKVKIICDCGCAYKGITAEIVSVGNSVEGTVYAIFIDEKTMVFSENELMNIDISMRIDKENL